MFGWGVYKASTLMQGALTRWLVVGAAWCLAFSPVAAAGQSGHLSGVIRDETSTVIAGVTVSLSGATLPELRTATTDDQGRYDFPDLPAGPVTLEATASGFATYIAEIDVGATPTTLDIVLTVTSYYERLTVTATKTGAADIQQTPIAITALPQRTLQVLGVERVAGLSGFVPSMTVA